MKTLAHSLALLAALALSPSLQAQEGHAHDGSKSTTTSEGISVKQAATQAVLRDMWVEHVFWIRNYVAATATHHEAEQSVAADQVVANAKAIAGAIGSFYGAPAGDQMLTLLAGHWGAVKVYSDASFAGDGKNAQAATEQLSSNARQIAAFLAKANPHLPEDTLVALLSAHGAHHLAQIQQILAGDYLAEAKTWAAMRMHMLTISDALAAGLAKQFPARF